MNDFTFVMRGRAFEEGDRLDKLIGGLTGLQHFFDGTFKALTDKSRITKRDREKYQIFIHEYKDGSFIANLGMILTGIQPLLPLGYAATPDNIWQLTVRAYEFLKLVYEFAHRKEEFHIHQDGENNTAVIKGDEHHVYNGPVYKIGQLILPAIREMDDVLEDGQVHKIALSNPETNGIQLLLKNKGLFYPPTTVAEEPVQISCDIFDFNKYEKLGKVSVPDEQDVPGGNYKFRNIGNRDIDDFILSMTQTSVNIRCLVKFEHDPLTTKKISELLVLDIAA